MKNQATIFFQNKVINVSGRNVTCRPLRNSEKIKLAAACADVADDMSKKAKMGGLIARVCLVGIEGEIGENGETFTTSRHPQLGEIATEQSYDALTPKETEMVMLVATGEDVAEQTKEAEGN